MAETGGNNDGAHHTGHISRRVTRNSSRTTSLQSSQEDVSTKQASAAEEFGSKVDEAGSVAAGLQQQDGSNAGITIECAICLQTCIHPVKLPCSHIFCFLCIKGVAFQSRRCAMCRQEIPADVLLHPQLVDRSQLEKETTLEDGYQWFYEGRNGWWQYDERTSIELECAYKRTQRVFELLIAGFLYTIDFDQMLQYRKTEPSRRRRIKRDLASIAKKGVAGLRLEQSEETTESSGATAAASQDLLSLAASRAALNSNCLSPSQTPLAPSNTPQTPQTPRSPPSPAPESNPSQDSGTQTVATGSHERWQERERRRLRRAVEEIERLRLNDDRTGQSNPPRLDNLLIYYNLDEEASLLNDGQPDPWQSEDSSSSEEDEINLVRHC